MADDNIIKEQFLSFTTWEKYTNTSGIKIYGYFIPAYALQ